MDKAAKTKFKKYHDATKELVMLKVRRSTECDAPPSDDEFDFFVDNEVFDIDFYDDDIIDYECKYEFDNDYDDISDDIRCKNSNKRTKIKNLVKSGDLSSTLKHTLYDSNGNVDKVDVDHFRNVLFNWKQNSCLIKGKSKLHVKYNIYKKFKLDKLCDSEYVKKVDRCKHVYSDAYMLKNPPPKVPKVEKIANPVMQPLPLAQPPPPPPPPLDVYCMPNYTYTLHQMLSASLQYIDEISKDDLYYKFCEKKNKFVENESVTCATFSNLPFKILCKLITNRTIRNVICKEMLESKILKELFVLLSLLTCQDLQHKVPYFRNTMIKKSDIINADIKIAEQPDAFTTNYNYGAKGTGYGYGASQQVWNVKLTNWKQNTEESHINYIIIILQEFLTNYLDGDLPQLAVSLFESSSIFKSLLSYIKSTSVMDILKSLNLFNNIVLLLKAIKDTPQLRGMVNNVEISLSVKSMLNMLKTYTSHVKDETLTPLIINLNELDSCLNSIITPKILPSKITIVNKRDKEKFYINEMKSVLFDSFKMIDESDGQIVKLVPFHYPIHTQSTSNINRSKRITQEIVTLADSLPVSSSSSVFVRCDEERIDVMKVLITGPEDTPYSNGCFEFDVSFPDTYPQQPPQFILKTTGNGTVRFNPNLYNCGKVCLSLLNTWFSRPEERWNENTSTLLQVLVSIQSLIFVSEPYFNEPGYQCQYGTPQGQNSSAAYNANIKKQTTKWAIVEMIKNPPACFADVIHNHFNMKKDEVRSQIKEWQNDLTTYFEKQAKNTAEAASIKELMRECTNVIDNLSKKLPKTEKVENDDQAPTEFVITI